MERDLYGAYSNLGLYLRTMQTLYHGITTLYGADFSTLKMGQQMKEVACYHDAYLLVEDGVIVALGGYSEAPEVAHRVDLGGVEVMPGFVDSHTHTVFAASREEEFVMRIKGATYEEIAEAGGGILNSARKLNEASEDSLFEEALERLKLMILQGTTTVEIKSGYGLTLTSELKMLRVIKRLKEALPIQIRSTFLGAHAFPEGFRERKSEYVELIIDQMLPQIVELQLADHIDVFCEKGFFTSEQAQRILEAARGLGLPSKIHGNQLGQSGGVELAVAQGSWSVDHLEYTDEKQWELLLGSFFKTIAGQRIPVASGTMPVALPGVSYNLGLPFTRGREMIDFGLPLALATDFNPGSSPVNSLQVVVSLACTQMKLTPEEAFNAITVNAALALRLHETCGTLCPGKRADFLVMKSQNSLAKIPYYLGQNQVSRVFVAGEEFLPE
jgi:imidazolonepropionase